jgi:hypothetical protein
VTDARRGNIRLIRAVTDTPVSRPLTDLLAATYGPLPVLNDLLAETPGITFAFVYGSWAARCLGEPGPVPGDVDVLVVGTAERHQIRGLEHAFLGPHSSPSGVWWRQGVGTAMHTRRSLVARPIPGRMRVMVSPARPSRVCNSPVLQGRMASS